jgi:acetoin utilization deacetylase AcuC-like enzyme
MAQTGKGKTGIIYSKKYLLHRTGGDHPDSPTRLRAIMRGIRDARLLENRQCILIRPQPATIDELQLVHTNSHIRAIREFCMRGGGVLDEETGTVASPESFEVARLAAGGAIQAVRRVMKGELKNAFVISRPPGHHACRARAHGFCLFNNIALAAKHLIEEFSLKRVLILDVDSHHGDGTQRIFYGTDDVLYISLHEDPSEFPDSGFAYEVGAGRGRGFTVNIPLPFGTSDPAYWRAMKTIVMPIIREYKPEFILVSAGFDGYFRDTLGKLSLSAYIYLRVFQAVLDSARIFSGDKLVAVLEGGYRSIFLKKVIPAIISRMAGLEARIRDDRPFIDLYAHRIAEKIIEEVKEIHSRFWTLC